MWGGGGGGREGHDTLTQPLLQNHSLMIIFLTVFKPESGHGHETASETINGK